MIICFLGIDGSGKTAYSLNLYNQLITKGFNCKYLHFKSVFLGKLLRFRETTSGNKRLILKSKTYQVSNKHNRTLHFSMNIILVKLYILLLLFDDILFYLCYFKFKQKEEILICDRYFYDSIVSNRLLGLKGKFITDFYYRIFPNPDILFLLEIDPKVAYERKKDEEILSDLINKSELYFTTFLSTPNLIKINSLNNFDGSSTNILNKVLESMDRVN